MACATEKRVDDSLSSGTVNCVFGDDYLYIINVQLAGTFFAKEAFGEVYWEKEIYGKEYRHSFDQDPQDGRNGDEKEQRKTTYKIEEVLPLGKSGAMDELLYQYCIGNEPVRTLFVTPSTKYRVAAEKDLSIRMIDQIEFLVRYIGFSRKLQAAQNCSTRNIWSGLSEQLRHVTVAHSELGSECRKEGSCNNLMLANVSARRLKEDANVQSAVLSIDETFSGSGVQGDIHEEYTRKKTSDDLPEHDMNTLDDFPEPGVETSNDLPEFGISDTEMIEKLQTKTLGCMDKSEKPDDVSKEEKKKTRFSEPVQVTRDNCNFNIHHCPLMQWFIYLLLLAEICALVKGAAANSCYDSESEGRSIPDTNKETVCLMPHLTCEASVNVTCPTSENQFHLWADNCQYNCSRGKDIVCLNSDYGMQYLCLPHDISCPAGIGWRIANMSNGYVGIIVGQCQVGYYQETPSRCYDACKDEHFRPDHIPDGLKIYREGDSSHPQLFMCDFTTGYFNPENKSFIKADSQFRFNIGGFCVNGPNPCSDGQMPLHNGTCVNHCQDGFERDAPDFICKQKNDTKNGSIVTVSPTLPPALTTPALTTPVPYDPPYDVPDNKTVASTDKTENITNEVDDEKIALWKILLYIIGSAVAGGVLSLFIFFAVRYLYLHTKKKKQKISHLNRQNSDAPRKVQNKTEFGNTNYNIGNGSTVNFYTDRNKTVPDISESLDETMLKSFRAESDPLDGAEESREVSGLLSEQSSRV